MHIFFMKVLQFGSLTPLQLETRFLGTKLPGFSVGRGSGALKGLSRLPKKESESKKLEIATISG